MCVYVVFFTLEDHRNWLLHDPPVLDQSSSGASQFSELLGYGFPSSQYWRGKPLVICYSLLLNMAIEIVDFPIKNGDFP